MVDHVVGHPNIKLSRRRLFNYLSEALRWPDDPAAVREADRLTAILIPETDNMTTKIKPGRSSTEFLIISVVTLAGLATTYFSGTVYGEIADIVVAAGTALGYSAHRAGLKKVEVAGQNAFAERADVMAENARQRKGS